MANKKIPLSQEEKIAAILNKVQGVDSTKAFGASLDITSKCIKCGKELSGLEKVTFFKKCVTCTKRDATTARENFFKRYTLLAVFIIAFVLMSSFFKNSEMSAMKIMGYVFESVFVCVTVFYICFDALPLILADKLTKKSRLLISLGFASGLGMTVITIELAGEFKALFAIFVVLVCGYAIFKAYKDYMKIKEQLNLLEVYERKSKDQKYVQEVSEAICEKAEQVVPEVVLDVSDDNLKGKAEDSVQKVETVEELQKDVPSKETETVELNSIKVKEEKKDISQKENKTSDKEDEGECWII